MSKFPNDLTTLWNHQEMGFQRAKDLSEFGFLFDVGTGKTLTCITTIRYRYAMAQGMVSTLILGPVITLANWKREFGIFSKTPEEKVIILIGPVVKRMKTAEKAIKKYGPCVFITNYDAIGRSKEFAMFIQKIIKPVILVLDESHRCKTHNTNTTKRINTIADLTDFRYIMTGTFITNSPFDAYSQFRILDKGKSFGRNFSRFQNKYFFDANYGMPKDKYFPDWKIRKGAYEEMSTIIEQKTMKALKEECIDLPELVKKNIMIDMTPEQKKAYKEMKKNLITYVGEEAVTADMALVKMLRLAQISSGFVKTEDGNIRRLKNEKEKVLKELLFDLCVEGKGKVIVWAVFHENYKQIREVCDKLKLKYVEGHGLIGTQQKYDNIDAFNEDDSISVCIGHPKSLGIGVNIIAAGTCIYFSRDFSLEARLQSEARNYRGGSIKLHSKITQIDLTSRDSIDETIDEALANKLTTAEEILKLVKTSF